MNPADLYERDFFQWAQRNAELLRSGRVLEADLENIAEELDDMARSERRALKSRLTKLLSHLLKWRTQPGKRSRSWTVTIGSQRIGIERILEDNPSLAAALGETIPAVYPAAVRIASLETGLPREDFPAECPFTTEQILDADYLP